MGDRVAVVLLVVGAALLVVSLGALGAGTYLSRRRQRPPFVVAPTILFAAGVMLTSVGWLTTPSVPTTAADAIRAGGLASAAVLAFYALWLNDQRRRTEQERLETERERGRIEQSRLARELEQLSLERLRIIDERFTKAIELLGHTSDRVRIGALIQLDGLTRTRPELIPDVLDQICGYLREPVDEKPSDELADERERRVRRHAQRVLRTVFLRTTESSPAAELDLTGAVLTEFRLGGGFVGTLRLDDARLIDRTVLRGVVADVLTMTNCVARDDVVLENGPVRGRIGTLVINGVHARIEGRFVCGYDLGCVDIESAEFGDSVEFDDLTVMGRFAAHARFARRLALTRVVFAKPAAAHDDESIELFQCEFGDLVLIDEVAVHGATRFAGIKFNGGLALNARFHGRISVADVLVDRKRGATVPAGWRLANHDIIYQRLVTPGH